MQEGLYDILTSSPTEKQQQNSLVKENFAFLF